MRQCIFCGNAAKSKEHLWPEWILKKIEPGKISGFIGHHKNLQFDREITVRTVCKPCNEGWMHKLECTNIPVMGPLIDDGSRFLDMPQLWSIAVWSLKTAMVMDSTTASVAPLFYTQEERDNLMESSTIPFRTLVWLGRFLGRSDIGASMSSIKATLDSDPTAPRIPARITTFLLNCLVIQVMTAHPTAEHIHRTIRIRPAEGPWDDLVIPCWPTVGHNLYWPPALAFNFGHTLIGWQRFADRYNLGVNVPIPPKTESRRGG
jgi:hypothetical protein